MIHCCGVPGSGYSRVLSLTKKKGKKEKKVSAYVNVLRYDESVCYVPLFANLKNNCISICIGLSLLAHALSPCMSITILFITDDRIADLLRAPLYPR